MDNPVQQQADDNAMKMAKAVPAARSHEGTTVAA
jgi:hypothetical protein